MTEFESYASQFTSKEQAQSEIAMTATWDYMELHEVLSNEVFINVAQKFGFNINDINLNVTDGYMQYRYQYWF